MDDISNNILMVENEFEGLRIDKYISGQMDSLSRTYIQKLFSSNDILVNSTPCKANYKVKAGDSIVLNIPELEIPQILPEEIPLDILYEDKDIIVINKTKEMVVHPAPGHYNGTLVNALLYHCRNDLSGINGVLRPGIVHRIDMDTTGAILACKNDYSHQFISEQLKAHSIQRKYQAIVHHVINEESGTIDAPIGRNPNDRKKMSINYKNGKSAVTHYRVLQRFGQYTYIECQLETGRTHQIRVHMTSIQHPLLGDEIYGPKTKSKYNLKGQTLHAGLLGIIHPATKEYMEFQAPLPAYFNKLLNILC